MMNKRFGRLCALCTVLFLLVSVCTSCAPSRSQAADLSTLQKDAVAYSALRAQGDLQPEAEAVADLTLAQQNDWLMLYYNEATAAVSVFDRRTGGWWHSNPAEATTPASRSQLNISTISSAGVAKQYTSYTDSLMKNQVAYTVRGGLTVTYTFGNPKTDLAKVPTRLTDARYDELVERIKQAGGNSGLLKRRYNHKDGVWTLKDSLTNDQAKKLREVFELIGYTDEELAADNAGAVAGSEDESFTVPLTYTLQGDSLRVYVDGEEMIYPENEIITSLDVLEYFGALCQDEEGYLFIPDGSGALVDTKVYGGGAAATLPLYGRDDTLPQDTAFDLGRDCLLPVFGIHRVTDGVLAIIEDNEAVASIDVVKPGHVDTYATVSAAFALNAAQNIGLSSDSISKFYVTSSTRYAGDTALRYVFLTEEDATYVGMAGIYRDYRDRIGKRTLLEKQDAIPFVLETVGAVKAEVSTAGIVHDTLVPLTTYDDNRMLLQQLQQRGVNNVALMLTGWLDGGIDSGLPGSGAPASVLGGKKGFTSLLTWAGENGVRVYPQVLLNSFSIDESLSDKNAYAAYSLDNKKSTLSRYEMVTGVSLAEHQRVILSPAWQAHFSQKTLDLLGLLGCAAVNLGDIATTTYSDYNADSEVPRQASHLQAAAITGQFAASMDVLLTKPNDLTADSGRLYTDVPKSSSDLTLAYTSVPFYQMVYHGYAQYSFTAMNYDVNLQSSILKCAEYGGCPKFQFIVREDARADFTDIGDYYASHYQKWLEQAAEAYTVLNDLLAPVANARMIGHASLLEGVYRTDYDNGMSIYVNYTDASVTVNDVTVAARSAIRKEGAV